VALDTDTGRVYWIENGEGSIERARFDGSAREAVNVSWTTVNPNGLALDQAARKIYVTDFEVDEDGHKGRIFRARVNGEDSEILIQDDSMQQPYGLALDALATAVYWTDRGSGKIQSLILRCLAGNLSLSSSTNASTARVPYEAMEHGGLQQVSCPSGYRGAVKLTCNDGSVTVSSGQCAKHCSRGTYEEDGQLPIVHGTIKDGASAMGICSSGLIGPVMLRCTDGKVTIFSGSCKRPSGCASGRFLVSHAVVEHPAMRSGGLWGHTCPSGFNGSFTLHCADGEVFLSSGACHASCVGSSSLWVDDGRVEISHTGFREGGKLLVRCPRGSVGPGVQLVCTRGILKVESGSCSTISKCLAGRQTISGVEVRHGPIEDGATILANCPDGYTGSVNVTCTAGSATVEQGSVCFALCPAGWVDAGDGLSVQHPASEHGRFTSVPCPSGYVGNISLRCDDGNTSLAACRGPDCGCRAVHVPSTPPPPPLPSAAPTTLAPTLTTPWVPTLTLPFLAVLCCIAGMSIYHWCCKGHAADAVETDTAGTGEATGDDGFGGDPNEVVVESTVPLPMYWATKEGVHIFPDPNRIDEIQRLMTETWRACYTRDRRLIAGERKVPSGCRVANVLRIENQAAYERYWLRKAQVADLRSSVGCEPFPTATQNRLNKLDNSLNETYLFHGTNPESAHAIAKELFRIDKAGSCGGVMFGPGVYLAENSSKSDEYAKEGAGVYVGLCAMLVCRAVMGRTLTVSGAGDYSGRVRNGEYDCVCGDRLAAAGTFREMIFFHEDAVYAEFIVIYARVYGDD